MTGKDRTILRELAKRQIEYANGEVNRDKIRRWFRHNRMLREPMVLAEAFGVYDEVGIDSMLVCEDDDSRDIELRFVKNLFHHEFIGDDSVIDPWFNIKWDINDSGYGVDLRVNRAKDADGREFGMSIDPPLKDLEHDIHKLKTRTFSVDRDRTLRQKEYLEDIFGDILPVRIHGEYWWSMGLSNIAIYLVGLEKFMMYMFDQPEPLHELMNFILEDRIAQLEWMEEENLLNMNNDNSYVGSGTRGFTDELVQKGDKVGSRDLWALLESQPTSHVSPDMFGEFVFGYQKLLSERFGLIYYGCCEPLHDRMHIVRRIPNLKSVSVSPFSDEERMADEIGDDYIYSRKPDPVLISTDAFSVESIRRDIMKTLETARNCEIEFIMKDVHTVRRQPERIRDWVRTAKQAIADGY